MKIIDYAKAIIITQCIDDYLTWYSFPKGIRGKVDRGEILFSRKELIPKYGSEYKIISLLDLPLPFSCLTKPQFQGKYKLVFDEVS